MNLNCGIVGLPNVGKSTLFNKLSGQNVKAENYPFCTINSNIAIVNVPDYRLNMLSNLFKIKKIVYSNIKFIDIAGLIKDSSLGLGLGNLFLEDIRRTNIIIHIIRCFHNKDIIHVYEEINPIKDKEIIDTELQFKDINIIDKRITKISKIINSNKSNIESLVKESNLLLKCRSYLIKGISLNEITDFNDIEKSFINQLLLLTFKPILYVANINEHDNYFFNYSRTKLQKNIYKLITIDIKNTSYKTSSQISNLIMESHKLLNLIVFFTINNKEIRSWSLQNGSSILNAANMVHSDFKERFICAEIYNYNEIFINNDKNILNKYRKKIVGKNYIIKDGDIILFKIR